MELITTFAGDMIRMTILVWVNESIGNDIGTWIFSNDQGQCLYVFGVRTWKVPSTNFFKVFEKWLGDFVEHVSDPNFGLQLILIFQIYCFI